MTREKAFSSVLSISTSRRPSGRAAIRERHFEPLVCSNCSEVKCLCTETSSCWIHAANGDSILQRMFGQIVRLRVFPQTICQLG